MHVLCVGVLGPLWLRCWQGRDHFMSTRRRWLWFLHLEVWHCHWTSWSVALASQMKFRSFSDSASIGNITTCVVSFFNDVFQFQGALAESYCGWTAGDLILLRMIFFTVSLFLPSVMCMYMYILLTHWSVCIETLKLWCNNHNAHMHKCFVSHARCIFPCKYNATVCTLLLMRKICMACETNHKR